jgi:hypothetical protein
MHSREIRLERCLCRLLGTTELNLDEMEDDTRMAIGEAWKLVEPVANTTGSRNRLASRRRANTAGRGPRAAKSVRRAKR